MKLQLLEEQHDRILPETLCVCWYLPKRADVSRIKDAMKARGAWCAKGARVKDANEGKGGMVCAAVIPVSAKYKYFQANGNMQTQTSKSTQQAGPAFSCQQGSK